MSRYYGRFNQDVNDQLAYTWNFRRFLQGDTISSFSITTTLTIFVATNDATTVTAIIGGGTVGNVYDVLCTIKTASGQQKDATILLTLDQE